MQQVRDENQNEKNTEFFNSVVGSHKIKTMGVTEIYNYSYVTHRLAYYVVGAILKTLIKFFWKFRVEGLEHVPKDYHMILMPNHLSHLDSVAALIPLYPKIPVHFIADEKLFTVPWFRAMASRLNVFPVRKKAKQLKVVNYSIDLVNRGSSLLWYPEGQRNKDPKHYKLNPGKVGSGWIAQQTRAPIIPVYLKNTDKAMPLGKAVTWGKGLRSIEILVKYGPPVYLDDLRKLPPSKEVSKEAVDRIMQSIQSLKDEYENKTHN